MYPKDFFQNFEEPVYRNTFFVIMPFSEDFTPVFEAIRDSLSNILSFSCERAENHNPEPVIISSILEKIGRYEFLIADLTNSNPNVMYELGIAHMVKDRSKIILISQENAQLPFDIAHFEVTRYSTEDLISSTNKLLKKVIERIRPQPVRFSVTEGSPIVLPNRFIGTDNYYYRLSIEVMPSDHNSKIIIKYTREGIHTGIQPDFYSDSFFLEYGIIKTLNHISNSICLVNIENGRVDLVIT
jgi:hypothetical protein